MWCTKHSAHVSSTYSLISAVAGVGVALAGADQVQWGWNDGKGLGAIFAGLGMAPAISAGFGAAIFMLIKLIVHVRKNPVPWAVWTSPFFFLVAGTICTLSIVYKGSPNLHLNKKPGWYVAAVTMGTGFGVAVLAAIFFVPFVHARIIKRDAGVKWYMFIQGPLLFRRPYPQDNERAVVPNYAVVQHDEAEHTSDSNSSVTDEPISKQVVENEKAFDHIAAEISGKQLSNKELNELSEKRLNEKLMKGTGPLAGCRPDLRISQHEDHRQACSCLHYLRCPLRSTLRHSRRSVWYCRHPGRRSYGACLRQCREVF
jgi:sodium-dependent phosphate transporter